MPIRKLTLLILVFTVIAAGWWNRESAAVRAITEWKSAESTGDVESLRKCKSGADTIYTNKPCPPGSQASQVTGGSLSIVPGQTSANQQDAKILDKRDLLQKDEVNLQAERIDRIIGK